MDSLTKLRDLLKTATRGEWHVGLRGGNVAMIHAGEDAVAHIYGLPLNTTIKEAETLVSERPEEWAEPFANAALICEMRNSIEALLECAKVCLTIDAHYDNQDLSHEDFRVNAAIAARNALPQMKARTNG